MVKKTKEKDIEEKIIKVAIEIAQEGNGALFVLGENVKYSKLLSQKFEPFNIFDRGAEKFLKGLAVIDGAVIIDGNGNVIDYAAMIKNAKAFIGFGTRHSAAMTASRKGNTSVMVSEEEKKVKIFKDGKYVMQIDALQKGIKDKTSSIVTMLETIGAGFIGSVGAVALAPTLGIALLPGVVIFGGSYFALKKILQKFH